MKDLRMLALEARPAADAEMAPSKSLPRSTALPGTRSGWFWPLFRVLLVATVCSASWFVANNWDRWTGATRFQRTDDAYLAGDLAPLSAN